MRFNPKVSCCHQSWPPVKRTKDYSKAARVNHGSAEDDKVISPLTSLCRLQIRCIGHHPESETRRSLPQRGAKTLLVSAAPAVKNAVSRFAALKIVGHLPTEAIDPLEARIRVVNEGSVLFKAKETMARVFGDGGGQEEPTRILCRSQKPGRWDTYDRNCGFAAEEASPCRWCLI